MHSYIKINKYYYNVEISVVKMAYLLMFKLKPLNIVDGKSSCRFIPRSLIKVYRIIRLLICIQLHARGRDRRIISLPIYGQIVLYNKRRNCYKGFNISRNIVTTVFCSEPGEAFQERLAYHRKIGEAGLGAKLINSHTEMYRYNEQYLNLSHVQMKDSIEQFIQTITPKITLYLHKINLAFPPKIITRHDYLTSKTITPWGYHQKNDKITHKLQAIIAVLNIWKERLLSDDEPIALSLSHGDLHLGNLLDNNNELIAIDWEFADWRSSSYDLCFFHYKVFKRMPLGVGLASRQLFYFEYIFHWLSVLCEQCSHYHDADLNHMADWILKDIERFRSFEQEAYFIPLQAN